MRRFATVFAALLLTVACGRPGERTDLTDDTRAAAAVAEPEAVELPVFDPTLFAHGRQVFESECAGCHSYDAPPLTAPTLREISGHYQSVFADPARGIAHIMAYIESPAHGRSMLPQVDIDDWGLMPPLELSQEQRRAVAIYIWEVSNTER